MPRLQADPITEDDGLAEREPRFRAVPFNEFLDRMPVPSLGIDRTEAVRSADFAWSRLGSRNTVLGTRRLPFPHCFFAVRRGPPRPQTDDGPGSTDEWRVNQNSCRAARCDPGRAG